MFLTVGTFPFNLTLLEAILRYLILKNFNIHLKIYDLSNVWLNLKHILILKIR